MRLERNARADPPLIAGVHTTVFRAAGPAATGQHANPVWKIVIPESGTVEWRVGACAAQHAAGMVAPPTLMHRASCTAGHLVVFVDAWYLGLGPGRGDVVRLDPIDVASLRAIWSRPGADGVDEAARETVAYLRGRDLLAPPVPIDPRLTAALQSHPVFDRVEDIADDMGLSPSQLRRLVHAVIGARLMRLRAWQRLRTFTLSLPDTPIAAAAAHAGFADQAHVCRTATRLVGRTPASLAVAVTHHSQR
jgi:AraC-like DNA-binding protein